MPALQTRQYGPFRGCMSSVDRDLIPLDRISGDSRNYVVDPLTGALLKRGGNALVTGSSTGILEAKWASKARRLFELVSASLSDSLPTHAVLVTNESTGEGQVAYRNTNSTGFNHVIGSDFGTGHYPSDGGSGVAEFIMQPLKCRHAPATAAFRRDYSRCIDSLQRRTIAGGTRGVVEMADELFVPSYSATPFRWNKRFNDDGTNGTEVNHIRPWYNQPPPWMPVLTQNAGTKGWANGNSFYYSVLFLMDDGSYTMPVIPREPSAVMANGYGKFTLSADSISITWTDIPIGPAGTKARVLLRSIQTNTGTPSPYDLRICGVILNNTSTSYVDTNSFDTDLALVKDPIKVRFDHVAPWRARYGWVADQRVFIGYRRPNPASIFLSFYQSPTPVTLNQHDSDTPPATVYSAAVRDDWTGAATVRSLTVSYGGVDHSYTIAASTSVQTLMDTLNAQVGANLWGNWRTQAVPGADTSAAASGLDITQVLNSADTVLGSPTLTVNVTGFAGRNFSTIQVGMRITGTGIPAATFVKAVTSSTLTLGNAAGASVNATANGTGVAITCGWEVGDEAAAVPVGQFRVFNGAYPLTIYWSETYLDSVTSAADKRTVMFTSGEPGWARNTPQAFFIANRLALPDSAGVIMGGADLLSQTVIGLVCGSKGIYVIHNPRGGNTGLDADIQLRVLNGTRGCIAPWSIVTGDGWVGYLTEDGYVVTDGLEERVVSRDAYNVSTRVGEWAYEIGQCLQGAAKDNADDCRFNAAVRGGKLYGGYRSSVSFAEPNRMMVYDFSPGLAASGLAEVTLAAGEAYGWSSPLIGYDETTTYFLPSAIGFVRKAAGTKKYLAASLNDATTDGNVEEFDNATFTDESTPIVNAAFYTKADRFDTLSKKLVHAIRVLYLKGTGTAHVVAYQDTARAVNGTVLTFPSASFSGAPERIRVDVPLTMKNNVDLWEMKTVSDDASNTNQMRVNMIEVDFEVTQSYQ